MIEETKIKPRFLQKSGKVNAFLQKIQACRNYHRNVSQQNSNANMEQKYLESWKSYFQHDLSKSAWRAKSVDKAFLCQPALLNQKASVNKFWSSLQKWESTVTPEKVEN